MFLFKKVFWVLGLMFLISLGGAGTQSNSLFIQGMGFIGILIGLIIFYIFGRMVWKGLGCLPSFLILSSIALFLMYALGLFNNGVENIGENILQFLGYKNSENSAPQLQVPETAEYKSDIKVSENFPQEQKQLNNTDENEDEIEEDTNEDFSDINGNLFANEPASIPQPPKKQKSKQKNIFSNVVDSLSGNKEVKQQERPFNPNDYPVVRSSVTIINADTFILDTYGNYFRLFGIDAPETNQTCANKQGRSYNCGNDAAAWLKSWIEDEELECHIIQQDTKGNLIGTCSFGPYDVGAALVNAGWAVALPKYAHIYGAYEIQAQKNQRGLWQGEFYKPWDWRKLQSRKPKIKIIRPKKRLMGIFG